LSSVVVSVRVKALVDPKDLDDPAAFAFEGGDVPTVPNVRSTAGD
jgi:hypothetical protein